MTYREIDNRIQEIETMVREACYAPTNVFGKGIWNHHIKWVVKFGSMLAEETGANHLVINLAALLHDYASIKSFALYTNHHIHGVKEAERILGPMGFSPKTIEEVSHCILTHRGSLSMERRTIEALCVADADAMAHFVGVPSLLTYAAQGKGLDATEAVLWVEKKLGRSWNKLSPQAKKLSGNYYKAAKALIEDHDRVEEIILMAKEKAFKESHRAVV